VIPAASETCSGIHKLIDFIWNKKELPEHWEESITVPFKRRAKN
jgi:hypothetical protein